MAKEKIAKEGGGPGAFEIALDAGAGILDEFSILDAGGAGSFASAAVETFIDVLDVGVRDGRGRLSMIGKLALRDVDHLVDAAAGRIGFQIPQTVGGARVQAKAAVNAARIVFVGRSGARNGLRRGHIAASGESEKIRVDRGSSLP